MSAVPTCKRTEALLKKPKVMPLKISEGWQRELYLLAQTSAGLKAGRDIQRYEAWERGGCVGPCPCPTPPDRAVDPSRSERAKLAYAANQKAKVLQ